MFAGMHTRRKNFSFKMITLYLIGLMSLIFVAHGFNVGTNLFNAVQYIGKIVLTSDGSNLSATGIVLDGNG